MDLPDITDGLLGTFLQHVESGLQHAQPPDFVGVVSPRHLAGKGPVKPMVLSFLSDYS